MTVAHTAAQDKPKTSPEKITASKVDSVHGVRMWITPLTSRPPGQNTLDFLMICERNFFRRDLWTTDPPRIACCRPSFLVMRDAG
jgi:hypothetical protein